MVCTSAVHLVMMEAGLVWAVTLSGFGPLSTKWRAAEMLIQSGTYGERLKDLRLVTYFLSLRSSKVDLGAAFPCLNRCCRKNGARLC